MQIGWQIKFKTISDKDGLVSIYTDSSVTDIVQLQAAEVPFETREDNNEDMLKPVRTQTGYIRVIDKGDLDGLMPTANKQRYVEYTEDGELKWMGYMQPDTFSEPWDSTPIEVEFPIVSPLGVLESCTLDVNDGLGVLPIARILMFALLETGVSYEKYIIPNEFIDSTYNLPLKVEVSRYNFFSENTAKNTNEPGWQKYEGDSCLSVFGWTAVERQKTLYFVSRNVKNYHVLEYTDLVFLAHQLEDNQGASKASSIFDIKTLELDGDGHTKSILQGKKKISIRASVNPVGEVVPQVNSDELNFFGKNRFEYRVNDILYAYEQTKMYSGNSTNIQMYMYAYDINNLQWSQKIYVPGNTFYNVSAAFVEYDRFKPEDIEEKRNYDYRSAIRINNYDYNAQTIPTADEAKNLPILSAKSQRIANYISGAFVVSSACELVEEEGNTTDLITTSLQVKFRIGNKYWTGDGWSTSETIFSIAINSNEKKIQTTKTLDMPYNGADGYVMPINETLSGEVELTIYSLSGTSNYRLYLDNFKVQYYGDDAEEARSDEQENIYSGNRQSSFVEDMDISLKMSTDNGNKAGYGIITRNGINVINMYNAKWGNIRPELSLLETAKSIYGRTSEKLELELVKTSATPIDIMSRNNKNYSILSESVNWKEESAIYTLEELP